MIDQSASHAPHPIGEGGPPCVDLHLARAAALHAAGDNHAAVEVLREALALEPSSASAYNALAEVFASLRDWATASLFLQTAVTLNPNLPEIHSNLGTCYLELNDIQSALESFHRAVALRPASAPFHSQLGNALRLSGRPAAAEDALRRAVVLEPAYANAYVNLGFLLYEQQDVVHAERCYRTAIAHQPEHAFAHMSLAHLLLRRGEFVEGWREYEWRWRWKLFPSPLRSFAEPHWEGGDLSGKRILLHAEQGFGDTLQFLRYVPLIAARGAVITLEVHPELGKLARSVAGVTHLIARGDPIPPFDVHCPLLSLPLAFASELESIPAIIPYLATDPAVDSTGQRDTLRVGLVWAGNPANRIDKERSVSLAELAPLTKIAGVTFFSLQRGLPSYAISGFPFAAALAQTGDFSVTAAALRSLDLILTVDTAVAHLAGALGRRVWILLPKLADWRWLEGRSDSPWYPTARLFRQQSQGDWHPVIHAVAQELALLAGVPRAFTSQQPDVH